MQLSEIISNAKIKQLIRVDAEKQIYNLTTNHEKITSDSIFFAIKGATHNGNAFARYAISKSAVVVTDSEIYAKNINLSGGKNIIYVEDARLAMTTFAMNFNQNPQCGLKIIMITGTNGKTSTAVILQEILEYAGVRTGIIGTLKTQFEEEVFQTGMTTPDPIELFAILKKMKDSGARVVVMEASAHALALKKLEGIVAEIAIFTNLTQDHLDFFQTMEKYGKAKKALFSRSNAVTAVVNADDELGREIIAKEGLPIISYGIDNICDVFCIFRGDMEKFTEKIIGEKNEKTAKEDGQNLIVNYLDEICEIKTHLLGKFNIYNLLSAITTARYLGVSFAKIKEAVAKIKGVQGRYQRVEGENGKTIIVDYAHTPDGIKNILSALRTEISSNVEKGGKLITIFGCGGNRDSKKREEMGKIAGENSEIVVVTSDNPRFEDPAEIARQVACGVAQTSAVCMVEQDRKTAISKGISLATKNDIVAILGKGHEEYMEIKGEKIQFSDVEIAREMLSQISSPT